MNELIDVQSYQFDFIFRVSNKRIKFVETLVRVQPNSPWHSVLLADSFIAFPKRGVYVISADCGTRAFCIMWNMGSLVWNSSQALDFVFNFDYYHAYVSAVC